jgi:hypothetical protein
MSWNCKMVEYIGDWTEHKVGDMFWGPNAQEIEAGSPKWEPLLRMFARHLSAYYYENNSNRRCLFVITPGLVPFCIDGQTWNAGVHEGGWTVTGQPPEITVHPSINLGGTYHGFLQNGVISDDCEGRVYNEEGYQVKPCA